MTLARSVTEARRKEVLEVQRWAEIRRMKFVEGLSIGEIVRRTGHGRNTVRRAIRGKEPPAYRRPPRPLTHLGRVHFQPAKGGSVFNRP
jgi:hypothetical protein